MRKQSIRITRAIAKTRSCSLRSFKWLSTINIVIGTDLRRCRSQFRCTMPNKCSSKKARCYPPILEKTSLSVNARFASRQSASELSLSVARTTTAWIVSTTGPSTRMFAPCARSPLSSCKCLTHSIQKRFTRRLMSRTKSKLRLTLMAISSNSSRSYATFVGSKRPRKKR